MRKIFAVITLLVLLVSSVFATDWVNRGTFENQNAGVYSVYFDFDATSPMNSKDTEAYLYYLREHYKKVDVISLTKEEVENENHWSLEGVKHNCYKTLEVYTDFTIEDWFYKEGFVIEFICWR